MHKEKRIVRRPRVVLSLGQLSQRLCPHILKLAREYEWDLLDLGVTDGFVPDDRPLGGALIVDLPDDPLAVRLRDMGCPAVRLGTVVHPEDAQLPAVLPDLDAAGSLAAGFFKQRGFKQVAFVGHNPLTPGSLFHSLCTAFTQRAGELELAVHVFSFRQWGAGESTAALRYARRAAALGEWLRELPKPVGVLTFNDVMGAKICTICSATGLAVPEEIAILGINNTIACEMATVPLSAIDIPDEETVREGMDLLHRMMNGKAVPPQPVMITPARVIERRSTDVLAVNDLLVARAMRYMWDHLSPNLSVDAVAAEVGVNRRWLERAFRKELGRGVGSEWRRRRLEICCQMLRTTDCPIAQLAATLGFRSGEYLHNAFKQAYGITPRHYRLRDLPSGQ